jgi:hypothetical protein
VFDSPQMLPVLFSFRKGLFIYTPILLFAIIGLIRFFKTKPAFFYGIIITLTVSIYILSSWWAWSYGICWGMRPMIDYYPLLALPLAAGFDYFFSKNKIAQILTSVVILLLIMLNLFQTWQYKNGLIHYDDMTRAAYFKGFFQTKITPGWLDLLSPYDWERRINGLPQIEYSEAYLKSSIGKYPVKIRGFNLQYAGINPKAQNAVAAFIKGDSEFGIFKIEPQQGDTVCIRASNGNLVSVSRAYDNVLIADAVIPGAAEKFVITYLEEDDNKIALRSFNGRYVSESAMFPNLLFATSTEISEKETFRLFVVEK